MDTPGHSVNLTFYLYLFIHNLLIVRYHRNFCRLQDQLLPMLTFTIDTLPSSPSVRSVYFYLAKALNAQISLTSVKVIIIHIFGNSADAISTHLRSCSICIVHLHLKISMNRCIDKNNTIAADTEMPVAKPSYQLRFLLRWNLLLPYHLHIHNHSHNPAFL